MTSTIRPRRSALYVPAANKKALAKASTLPCDSIIYDLEDAVSPEQKIEARAALEAHFEQPFKGAAERVIRINAEDTEWGADDLAAAIRLKPDAILIPKVEKIGHVTDVVKQLEKAGATSVRIWAMIETPKAILNLPDIANLGSAGENRLDCFVVGTNDLAKATDVSMSGDRTFMLPWLMQIILNAKAFNLSVLDGVYNDFRDSSGFERECKTGAAMGFDGKTLIHPGQIEAATTAFSPSDAEVEAARKIVAAFERPENAGKGIISLDGEMVERLHLDMAQRLLAKT